MSGAIEVQDQPAVPASDASSVLVGKGSSSIAEVPVAAPETAEETKFEEPQNALTKQFTEDEWTALKVFRVGGTVRVISYKC